MSTEKFDTKTPIFGSVDASQFIENSEEASTNSEDDAPRRKQKKSRASGAGRKPEIEGESRDRMIGVNLTATEKDQLVAKSGGVPLSTFIRLHLIETGLIDK